MTTKTFAIRTEPHEAIIGSAVLLFEPEVLGSEFAEAYDTLREVQRKVKAVKGNGSSSTKHAKAEDLDTDTLIELSNAMRNFVSRFLLVDSREVFAGLRLPDRVLAELMEYVAELYGSGSGNRDAAGGTSSD